MFAVKLYLFYQCPSLCSSLLIPTSSPTFMSYTYTCKTTVCVCVCVCACVCVCVCACVRACVCNMHTDNIYPKNNNSKVSHAHPCSTCNFRFTCVHLHVTTGQGFPQAYTVHCMAGLYDYVCVTLVLSCGLCKGIAIGLQYHSSQVIQLVQ